MQKYKKYEIIFQKCMQKNKLIKIQIETLQKEHSKDYLDLYVDFLEFFDDFFQKQSLEYIAQLDNMPELKKTSDDILKKVQKLLELWYSLGQNEWNEEISKELARSGYEYSMEIDNSEAIEYAQTRGWELVSGINETTAESIWTIISDGIKNKNSKEDIILSIQEKFAGFSLYRASLIAHQELAVAYSTATRKQNDIFSNELGVIGWKRSVTQKDSAVRDSHKYNENEWWIPKNQVYWWTGTDIAPHGFNCRCHDEYSLVNPETWLLYGDDEVIDGYTDEQINTFNSVQWSHMFEKTVRQREIQAERWYTDMSLIAIEAFTWNAHINLNKWYRLWIADKNFTTLIKPMHEFLNKTPVSEGIFWRGEKVKNKKIYEKFANMKVWEVFAPNSFFSHSSSKTIAEQYMDTDFPVLIKTYTNKARSIEDFSSVPAEKEYLFMPKTLFSVSDIEKNTKTGILTLTLTDI